MSFGSKPQAPDPYQTSQTQLGFSKQAAETQQKLNMFNQSGPYGSQTFTADPNSPSGYAANVALSPEQQTILNNTQNAQQRVTAGFGDMYSQPPNFVDPNALMQQQLKLQQAYWNPIFQQQQSNLDAKLRNQGLAPGSVAWNNAQNLQARNQGDITNQFMMQMQPITFQEMMQNYQLPMSIASQLRGMQPGMPQFINTPQATVGAPNYAQMAQNKYQADQANYAADQQGIFGALGMGASLAMAPFTGGTSLLGMFGNGLSSIGGLMGNQPFTGGLGQGGYAGGWG